MPSKTVRFCLATLAVVFGLLAPASAQSWTRRHDGGETRHDFAYAVATGADNSIYVAGSSLNANFDHDIKVVKYSPTGALLWARTFAGPAGEDIPHDIIVRGASVYVVGRTYAGPTNDYDFVTIKYSSSGAFLWSRSFNGTANLFDEANRVAVDNSDNVYVTGVSTVETAKNLDYVTIKYSPSGARLWAKRFNGPFNGWEAPVGIVVDGVGDAYVTGTVYRGSPRYTDIHVIKYRSSDGATLWSKYYNGPGGITDESVGIALSGNGSLYVAGTMHAGPVTQTDFVTLKIDPATGGLLWSRGFNFGRTTNDYASGLAVDGAGNVYVAGTSSYYTGYNPVYVSDYLAVKYDARGNLRWYRSYFENDANCYARAIAVTGAGDVFVTGEASEPGRGYDLLTLHLAGDGTLAGSARYDGPEKDDDHVAFDRGLAVDAAGNAIVAGRASVGLNNDDILTLKYGPSPVTSQRSRALRPGTTGP